MSEFTRKIDRLIERLHRGTIQCDSIERRACIAEEHLTKLDKSVQILARLMEISFLLLISSDKEKLTWLKLTKDHNSELTNPIMTQFFSRLELYLRREIIDYNEKQAYMQALFLLQSPSIVSLDFS